MPWAHEFLKDLGLVNGSNKSFTLSNAPLPGTLRVCAFPPNLLEPVGSQPEEMQFMRDGAAITLGLAPTDNRAWLQYFYEEP